MLQLRAMRFGAETFALPFADADEVEALRRTDPQAALALARRKNRPNLGDKAALHVPMSFCDHLTPELARMAERMSQENNTMTTVTIGDQQLDVDPRVAAELGRLRAAAAMQDARAAMPDSVRYVMDARDALLRQQVAADDPSTARGRYIARQRDAHRQPANYPHG